MAFTYKLEHEDGTFGRPADVPEHRAHLAAGRHDPARRVDHVVPLPREVSATYGDDELQPLYRSYKRRKGG